MATEHDTITVLTASSPATKTHRRLADGWNTQGFTLGTLFAWREEPAGDIYDLARVIAQLAPKDLIIRGRIHDDKRDAHRLPRRLVNFGGTHAGGGTTPCRWAMIDLDCVEVPEHFDIATEGEDIAEWLIGEYLPEQFRDVTCYWQLSSSAGIKPGVSVHLFFWLDRAITGSDMKTYLKAHAPRVDLSLFGDVQVHYVAAPIFADGCVDPVQNRAGTMKCEHDHATIPEINRPALAEHARVHGGARNAATGGAGGNQDIVRDVTGKVVDGREAWLTSCTYHIYANLCRNDAAITVDGIAAAAWRYFVATTAIERPRDDGSHWSWADAVRKARYIVRKHKAGEFEIEPHYPARGLSVRDARQQLDMLIDAWIAQALTDTETPPQLGIKAAAGLGKTVAVVNALARRGALADKCIEIYVPTHNLAHEIAGLLRRAAPGLRVLQIQGRSARRGDGYMCAKADIAEDVAKAGLPVSKTLCNGEGDSAFGVVERCEHYDSCPYIQQLADTAPGVRIMSHQYLPLPRGGMPTPDLVVIDERCWQVAVRHTTFAPDKLTKPRALIVSESAAGLNDCPIVGGYVLEALQHGRPLLATLRERDVEPEELRTLAQAEYAAVGRMPITPGMSVDEQRRKAEAYVAGEAFKLARMWRLLAEEMEHSERDDAMRVTLRGVPTKGDGLQDRVVLNWLRGLDRVNTLPVLLIDADLDDVLAAKLFPHVAVETLPVERNAEVVQVYDTAASKASFLGVGNDKDQARVDRRLRDTQNLIDAEAYGGKRVLVVAMKAVAEQLQKPEGGTVTYFGNIRGIDAWKDYDTVIVIGRFQPPTFAIDDVLRAVFWDRDEPLKLVGDGELTTQKRGYRLREGMAEATVAVHPDADGQRILEQYRECETAQAIDRLRLIHNETPKRVVIVSNVVCDVTVDRLDAWRDVMPCGLTQAFIRHGACPLTAGELARCFSDLWPSEGAVKQSMRRAQLRGYDPLIDILLGLRTPLIVVEYRRRRQRGSPSRAVIDASHGDEGAQAALETVTGPMTEFRVIRRRSQRKKPNADGYLPPLYIVRADHVVSAATSL
jgi:hypothetical protein